MALFDLPLDELEVHRPARSEPADFDAFWQATLSEARAHPLEASFEPVDYGLTTVDTFDVSFRGHGGQPIRGWLLTPRHAAASTATRAAATTMAVEELRFAKRHL